LVETNGLLVRNWRSPTKRIILAETEITRGLPGKYGDTRASPDGRFETAGRASLIPYLSVFDKDQRVTHTAITENKRLSAAPGIHQSRTGQKQSPKKRCAGKATRYQANWQTQRRLELKVVEASANNRGASPHAGRITTALHGRSALIYDVTALLSHALAK
jgi:hypothetical protein